MLREDLAVSTRTSGKNEKMTEERSYTLKTHIEIKHTSPFLLYIPYIAVGVAVVVIIVAVLVLRRKKGSI